jgi:hypothetical protein
MLRRIPLIAMTCALGGRSASADQLDWHATAAGSVATTDNQTGAETGSPGRKASVFTDVRPGMLLTYNSPRHIHEMLGEVDFLYNLGAERPSVTFRGGWKVFLLTGPRSEGSASVDAAIGQLSALTASNSPTETATLVQPLGRVDTKQVSGSEQLSWRATKSVRLFQRGFTRYTGTADNDPMAAVSTEAFETGTAVGMSIRRKKHNFVVEAGASYLHLDKYDPFVRQMGSREDNQLNPRGVAVWQHDISQRWSSNLDVGMVYVNPVTELFGRDMRDKYMPDRAYSGGAFPIFGGVLAYSDVWGRATLNVRRSVTPNLFIAQNTIADSAVVTFAMPLTFLDKQSRRRDPKVVGIGTAGVDRTQLIDPLTGNLRGQFNVARLDFAVAWQPRKGQTLGLRYEFAYQRGDTVGETIVPTFFRNTFYFTFALRFPEQVQVRVPRRSASVRADQGDLAPIGAEPVVVDPAELLEGDGR